MNLPIKLVVVSDKSLTIRVFSPVISVQMLSVRVTVSLYLKEVLKLRLDLREVAQSVLVGLGDSRCWDVLGEKVETLGKRLVVGVLIVLVFVLLESLGPYVLICDSLLFN